MVRSGASKPTLAQHVEHHYKDHREYNAVDDKWVTSTSCIHCLKTFMSFGADKRIAHASITPGCGVVICDQSVSTIEPEEIARLRPLFKKGREYAEKQAKLAPKPSDAPKEAGDQKPLINSIQEQTRRDVDALLAEGHHDQGNVADSFWDNPAIRKALKRLALADSFDYEPPKRRKMGGQLLNDRHGKMVAAVSKLQDNVESKTLTMDGWETLSKLHWLAKCIITPQGGYFKDAVDCSGVESMNAEWTLKVIMDFLKEEGGANDVAAVVLDGPSVNKSALKKMEEEEPTVCALICLCHVVSGFFKAVFKLPKVKEAWRLINNTGNKFRNVKWLHDALEQIQETPDMRKLPQFKSGNPLSYQRAGTTSFATRYLCTARALKVNPAAKAIPTPTRLI